MHLYERIFEDLRRAVDEGDIGPGERLPSIREVAERYDCNKLTAGRAFELLARSGRIENRVGAGSFARAAPAPDSGKADFSTARLSESFFPYEEAGGVLAGLLASERGRLFSAPESRGEPRLIDALSRRFRLPADSILVTGGGQQGLDLVRRLFAGRAGSWAVVEEPSYPGALSTFKPRQALAFGDEGPDPESLGAAFEGAPASSRFFYTVPQIHNPTGLAHSLEVRRAIAKAAETHDFTIVEDDYLSEFVESPLPRYVDLAPDRTLWIKSLSKTLAPGIRIGVLAASPARLSAIVKLRDEVDQGPSTWLQLFAAGILESGLYERHLARVGAVADRRRGELVDMIGALSGLRIAGGLKGYNLWVEAPETRSAGPHPWAEGWRFGRGEATRRCFRLSLMGMGEEDWPEAKESLRTRLVAAFGRD
ncbi:MAG TPA: PLP-dependent aminotransferase family protein [Rectinemataceae bacterium]|nr:PLP-dependent aminotransferase family protein [Rectinemataceae bacterium]